MAPYQLIQDFLENPRRILTIDAERIVESTATLVRRLPTSIKSTSPTCTGDARQCQKPTDSDGSDTNLIIALGISIPLTVAAIAFYLMYRRGKKRQQIEDYSDRNASLDFGLGENERMPKGMKTPEMTEEQKVVHQSRSRGMSLEDMMGAPYALPNALQDSRGSLHSLSRVSDSHDPYRPIHMMRNSSQMSLNRPPTYMSRPGSGKDTSSIWTSASGSTAASAKKSLIFNAQSPSRTSLLGTTAGNSNNSSASGSPPNPSPIDIPESAFIRKPVSPVNGAPIGPIPHQRLVREGSDAQGQFVPRESLTPAPRTESPPAAQAPTPVVSAPQLIATNAAVLPGPAPTPAAIVAALEPAPAPAPAPSPVSAPAPAPIAAPVSAPAPTPAPMPAMVPQKPQPRQQQPVQQPIRSVERSEPIVQQRQNQPQQQRQTMSPATPGRNQPRSQSAGRRHNSRGRASMDNVPSSPMSAQNDETYADVLGIVQKESRSPVVERHGHPQPMPTVPEGGPAPAQSGLGLQGVQYEAARSPRGDNSPDNAEQRANRIRSFYKEYFDPSSPPQGSRHHAHKSSSYSQDYNQEHFYGAPIYDPNTGDFYMAGAPYAQPINRRAMTPPPRAPPKSFRNSPVPQGQPRPRGYSSASAPRQPGTPNSTQSRGRTPRRIQPPAPLTVLPTPGQMKDDSALYSPTDFAPPMSFRSRAAGGMSPNGGERVPYSPNTRAFSPLMSSFDDLAHLPSAHGLRKSASFTGLDFAPPSRFGAQSNNGTTSDAGSVRSGRSHGTSVSAAQLANIRAGAYRLSRVPKDVVGSRNDMSESLKPRMDMSR